MLRRIEFGSQETLDGWNFAVLRCSKISRSTSEVGQNAKNSD